MMARFYFSGLDNLVIVLKKTSLKTNCSLQITNNLKNDDLRDKGKYRLINVILRTSKKNHIHERVFWKHNFHIQLLFCQIYNKNMLISV